jgi:serine/threonine protein kinase
LKNLIDNINNLNRGVDYIDYMNEIQIQNIIKQILNGLECLHKTRKMYNAISTYNIYINFDDEKQFELEDPKYREYYQKFKTNDDMKYTIKIKYFISEKERKRAIGPDIYYDENLKYYLAPEILEKLDVDDDNINTIAADMWSLGIITYELLVGKKFFSKANEIIDILDTIKEGLIPFKDYLCPSLQIIQFITSLLKLDPKERPTFDQIKNLEFLKEDPVNFDFMDFSLFKKPKNEVILNITEKNPIYVYLIGTTMENKIDISANEAEEQRLKIEIQINNRTIAQFKEKIKDLVENMKTTDYNLNQLEKIKNELEDLQKKNYDLEQKLKKLENNKNKQN